MSPASTNGNGSLDGIIVLGAGWAPDFIYASREEIAEEYSGWNGDEKTLVIVSGGRGLFCKNMKLTEAERLKRGLETRGVKGVIKVEDESRTTRENFENSAWIVRGFGIKNLGVVTNSGHMARSLREGKRIFREKGVDCDVYPLYRKHYSVKDIASEFCVLIYEGVMGLKRYFF